MNSNLIQQLELDILQLKRDMIALDIIASSNPGEFTREEENKALARFTAHSGMLAMHALVPLALIMPEDTKHFNELADKLRDSAMAAARETINLAEEAQHGQG